NALRMKAASIEAKDYAAGLKLADDQTKALLADVDKFNDALLEQNKALQLEHDTLGLDDIQRQIYIANLHRTQEALAGNVEGVALLTRQIELLNQKAADQAFLK